MISKRTGYTLMILVFVVFTFYIYLTQSEEFTGFAVVISFFLLCIIWLTDKQEKAKKDFLSQDHTKRAYEEEQARLMARQDHHRRR